MDLGAALTSAESARAARSGLAAAGRAIAAKLARGEPLAVTLLNDVGFIGGAGKALRRQAQSFLVAGWSVRVVCGMEQEESGPPHGQGLELSSGWRGITALPATAAERGMARPVAAAAIVEAVLSAPVDLVVTGNFHWTGWPLAVIAALADRGVAVVSYLHDMHWISGRCAYAGSCRKFTSGCDAACPTPSEYPPLEPDRIADAWRERRCVFVERGVPLAANSAWMAARAVEGFAGRARVITLPLAVDTARFAPIDRRLARRLLGLPEEARFALAGAIDLGERRKGGHIIAEVVPRLAAAGIGTLAFGHNSQYLPGVRGLGFIGDERIMPVVLSAADLFLNASLEESFGQTLLEAAACGVPSVAIARGGVTDIARDGENAVTVGSEDPAEFAAAAIRLAGDERLRARLGQGGRDLVEREFTLARQAARWREALAAGSPWPTG